MHSLSLAHTHTHCLVPVLLSVCFSCFGLSSSVSLSAEYSTHICNTRVLTPSPQVNTHTHTHTHTHVHRALLECFYVYVWALSHIARLGWTGERVVLTGDSAGGNLTVAVALKCAMEVL